MSRRLRMRRPRTFGGGAPPPSAVPFSVIRRASGSGSTLSTGAVFLATGALTSLSQARTETTGGAEIASSIQDTGLRHTNGSIRAVRVQLARTLTIDAPEALVLRLGTAQSLPVTFQPIVYPVTTFADHRTVPVTPGLVYQTDPAAICAGFPGPRLQPVSADPTIGPVAAYNAKFDATGLNAYNNWGGGLNGSAGQYDRTWVFAQQYARRGDVQWLIRAMQTAAWLHTSYWLPGGYAIPEWLVNPDGMLMLDVMFGTNDFKRFAFNEYPGQGAIAEPWTHTWLPGVGFRNALAGNAIDARALGARGLRQLLTLRRLGHGESIVTFPTGPALTVNAMLLDILSAAQASLQWQSGGGTWWTGLTAPNRSSNNFMIPILVQAMIECADEGIGDATLRAAVTTRCETVLSYYWANVRPTEPLAFNEFIPGEPDAGATTVRAPDLEGFWPPLFGHLIQKNVNPTLWRTRGDLSLGVIGLAEPDGPFLSALSNVGGGSHKQFNEAFHRSQSYIAARA